MEEYRCVEQDKRGHIARIVITVEMIIILISSLIGIPVSIAKGHMEFYPEGLVLLLIFGLPSGIGTVGCLKNLLSYKQGIFVINDNTCSLSTITCGKIVFIKHNLVDIQQIVIKNYKAYRCIVLVDNVGTVGFAGKSRQGDYIKLQYTNEKLENIKKFLPKCPVIYSQNTDLGRLF